MSFEPSECPVCLETIEQTDGFYTLDCCHQKAHLKCLLDWHRRSQNNKCPMCQQECSLYIDAAYINIPSNSPTIIVDEEDGGEIMYHRPERCVGLVSLCTCMSMTVVYLILIISVKNYAAHRLYTL